MNKSESRYFRTAVKMNNALIELLQTKPFEYITIREICEKAGVNRSTFYLHYENTRDLLNETTRHLLNDFLSYFQINAAALTSSFSGCDLAELNFISDEYLHPYLTYIRERRHIFLTALTHADTFDFESIYRRMFQHIFNPILDRFHYPAADRDFVMLFYLNGILAIVTRWLQTDCQTPIPDVSRIISTCIFGRASSVDNCRRTDCD